MYALGTMGELEPFGYLQCLFLLWMMIETYEKSDDRRTVLGIFERPKELSQAFCPIHCEYDDLKTAGAVRDFVTSEEAKQVKKQTYEDYANAVVPKPNGFVSFGKCHHGSLKRASLK
tara:strand:- start:134 stop:484 length:351 start_codon:yes stop_codon:yes gene_type:complete